MVGRGAPHPDPLPIGRREGDGGSDAGEVRAARPRLAFDVMNRMVPCGDDLSAGAEERRHFVEDRLVHDFGLENEEGLVAFGGQRAVGDKQFVQDVEFAKVPEP